MPTQPRFWLDKEKKPKKMARVASAVPDHADAWLNNHVRFLNGTSDREITKSELLCNWIMEKISEQQGLRKSTFGLPQIREQWEAVKAAMDAVLGEAERKTKTA